MHLTRLFWIRKSQYIFDLLNESPITMAYLIRLKNSNLDKAMLVNKYLGI